MSFIDKYNNKEILDVVYNTLVIIYNEKAKVLVKMQIAYLKHISLL